ncbi:MAG: DUF1553 domain-containing protein [Fimbriimonas sp.]
MKLSPALFVFCVGLFGFAVSSDSTPVPREVNFGRDVMPILSQRCFKCHGPDAAKVAAGLRLDSLAGAQKWGVIVPGFPERSRLIARVSESDAGARMPPADSGVKSLSKEQIETLREWIRQGARYEKHWSVVTPVMPKLPSVSRPDWCRNPFDRFVLAKLDAAGLSPEAEADRDTLALRAAQTLTGLPPTQAELAAFRKDVKPGAYERFVDRILAKPSYGEHQARYWLDAVRYGDTHGLQLDNERSVYPYRDWVVRAFNQDLPYTKFVEWQLAGDLLPRPTTEQLIATGYVRMNLTSAEGGAIEEEFLARNTFDRVDTTSTLFLGMTIQCARCHDHKFDPIKQRDYYGLYAYFNSTKDAPLDGNISLPPPVLKAPTPDEELRRNRLTQEIDALSAKVDLAQALQFLEKTPAAGTSTKNWEISPTYSGASFDLVYDQADAPETDGQVAWKPLAFEVGKAYSGIIAKDASSVYVRGTVTLPSARSLTFGLSSDDAVKVWLNGKLIHANKVSRGVGDAVDTVKGDFRAGDNLLLIKVVNGAGPDGLRLNLADPNAQRLADSLTAYRKDPKNLPAQRALQSAYLETGPVTASASRYRGLVKQRAELDASIPMTLIAQEMDQPRPTFILNRGQYDQRGEPVKRGIPVSLGSLPTGVPNNRYGFAKWLTSPKNPLLARVYVNRVWQQHFGTAIVKTTEDFGSQGEWPLNQPLLDYLAVSFQKNGWSIKQLNRMIVTSATFRQSSRIAAAKLAKDPENRLISRGPRFRLDAEVIRDKALDAGGLLLDQVGGRGFKPYQPDGIWEAASDPASSTHFYVRDKGKAIYRRSMYLFWKRTAPPTFMTTFDAPSRDTCVVSRSSTNTPLQALTTQNEPALLEASRTMAQRLLTSPGTDDERLGQAYLLTLARTPKATEVSLLKRALRQFRQRYSQDQEAAKKLISIGDAPQKPGLSPSEQAAWMLICSMLFNTDEFLTLH